MNRCVVVWHTSMVKTTVLQMRRRNTSSANRRCVLCSGEKKKKVNNGKRNKIKGKTGEIIRREKGDGTRGGLCRTETKIKE